MKSMTWMMLGVLAFGFGLGMTGNAEARIAKCTIDPECMAACEGVDCYRICCIP